MYRLHVKLMEGEMAHSAAENNAGDNAKGNVQHNVQDNVEVISTLPAGPRERRIATAVILLSIIFFLVVAPFAKVGLAEVWPFIPIYQSALVINDLITSMLLFAQFHIVRLRALLVVACGYLFTTAITIAHTLSFPGLFSASGLGAGAQTTAWIYMLWHIGFPLFVIAYAWLKNHPHKVVPREHSRAVVISSVAAVLALAAGIALLTTAGHDLLPPIMVDHGYTPLMIFVVGSTWAFSVVALAAMWRQRPHTVLDLWLTVVMCAWIFDIALAAVLNAGRFDVGFYAGRIYGLLAASFVLIMLLFENSVLYSRLAERTAELKSANKELESFAYSVSHDLRAPLRAMDSFTRILETDYGAELDAEGLRVLGRVRAGAERMGRLIEDLLAFSRLGREPLRTEHVSLDELTREVIDEQLAQSKGRELDISVGRLGEAEGDPTLLRQVLANLLGNAIKFTAKTPEAAVEVGCLEGSDGQTRTYYVKDNGAGFDMQYAGKLFSVFQRFHRPDEFEGTGVGLAIVQRIIHRHGGRIWADAEPGRGATFFFTLGKSRSEF